MNGADADKGVMAGKRSGHRKEVTEGKQETEGKRSGHRKAKGRSGHRKASDGRKTKWPQKSKMAMKGRKS